MTKKTKFVSFMHSEKRSLTCVLLIVAIIALFSIIEPAFFSVGNLRNTLMDISLPVIIAIGMGVAIAGGGLDMSVGAICGLSALFTSMCIVNFKLPIVVGILAGVLIGAVIGLLNGLMVSRLGVSSFVATLAMQFLLLGIRYMLTNGRSISRFPDEFLFMGKGSLAGIPILTLIMLVLAAVMFVVIEKSTFGRKVTALGMNIEACRFSGLNIKNYTMILFVFSGVFAAICGVLFAAKTGVVSVNSGDDYTLEALAVSVFSAVIFGRMKLVGIVMAAIIIVLITNGLSMAGADASWTNLVKGLVMMAAVIVGKLINKRTEKA